MRRLLVVILVAFATAFAAPALAQKPDVKGSQDHPAVGRYEGAYIKKYLQKQYEEFTLPTRPITRETKDKPEEYGTALAGRLTRITYEGPEGRSALEVVRNFQKTLEADGFETVFYCRHKDCGDASSFWFVAAADGGLLSQWATNTYVIAKKKTGAEETWVSVFAVEHGGSGNRPLTPQALVTVAEVQGMEEDKIVVRDASAMEKSIAEEGRVALYGLYFDFDKDTMTDESRPQLDEIAKLLTARFEMAVLIVGHTDSQGSLDYNLDLSRRRAASVVSALVRDYNIDANRLTPVGVGMAAPVASNRTDEGQAKNRRVEIVER